MAEAEDSDADNVMDLSRKHQPSVGDIHPERSQGVGREPRTLPGINEMSRGQVSGTPTWTAGQRREKVQEAATGSVARMAGMCGTGQTWTRSLWGCPWGQSIPRHF